MRPTQLLKRAASFYQIAPYGASVLPLSKTLRNGLFRRLFQPANRQPKSESTTFSKLRLKNKRAAVPMYHFFCKIQTDTCTVWALAVSIFSAEKFREKPLLRVFWHAHAMVDDSQYYNRHPQSTNARVLYQRSVNNKSRYQSNS